MTTSAVAEPNAEPDPEPEDAEPAQEAAAAKESGAARKSGAARESGAPTRQRRTAVTVICWAVVVLWAVIALLRWLGFDGAVWPLVVVPAMTPYLAVGALIPLILTLASRRWLAALVSLGVLAGLVAMVLPRTLGQPDPARGPAVRAMTANLREGGADPASVVALVRDNKIDVIALEELTEEERAALDAAGLSDLLPYAETNPRRNAGGTGIYSRYPLTDGKRIRLIQGFTETSATVHVPDAQPVIVTAVHYCAPADPTQMLCWQYGKEHIPAATPTGPVRLLLGDFNMTVDYAAMRGVLATGYSDAASVLGEGLVSTWPYDGTPLPKVTIDHVLADRRIGVSSLNAYTIKNSDHRALGAVLTLPKS